MYSSMRLFRDYKILHKISICLISNEVRNLKCWYSFLFVNLKTPHERGHSERRAAGQKSKNRFLKNRGIVTRSNKGLYNTLFLKNSHHT
jgi:hypothetical protein